MYAYLSKYYDQIFSFHPDIKSFIEPYVKKHGKSLDLGCGTGRLTKQLKAFDMDVIGVDLDQQMIDVAKSKYPDLSFKVEDMLDTLKSDKTYDLITCFGNTIVHLNDHMLNMFFQQMYQRLNTHGFLLIQTLHYDLILEEKPSMLQPIETEDLTFNRYYTYHQDYIEFMTKLHVEGQCFQGSTVIYPYQIDDFIRFAEMYNLTLHIYGGLLHQPINKNSQHIYYVFQKK